LKDYKIQLVGRTKTFHANMLKKYSNREQEIGAMVIESEIPDKNEMKLFTSLQTDTYKDIKINLELTEKQKGEIMEVSEEFKDVFTDVPGLTNLGKCSISLTTDEPIYSKPYPLLHAMQSEVEKELDTMLKLGVIEPCTSSYVSPIVVLRKPDGSNRICVDFRKLNKITVFDPEPMPKQIFSKLKRDQYFATSL